MKISGKVNFDCVVCALGKQTQVINRKPNVCATSPWEFIHTDLCGPIDPVSSEGFKYAMSFIEDYSNYVFIYFLKLKSDASKALENFLADSAPYGHIKCIHSDNGGEFVSHEFKSILIKNRIKHEMSSPYSTHQNGTAERWWRTGFKMGRCLLKIESKLPKRLWPYSVMTAAYVRNRCYNQRIKQTSYFLLTGKIPDISNMYAFGSICYGLEQPAKKLDARSKKGIFVGYDKESPSYLIYFPDKDKI